MKTLLKDNNFWLFCSSIILSSTGSWLLLYALSISIYLQTESLVASSMVFFSKIIPSAFAGILGGNLADRIRPRHFLRLLNIAACLTTLSYLFPVSIHHYGLLYMLIGIRSFFDYTEAVAREVSILHFFPTSLRLKANALMNTTNLVAMAVACSAGILLIQVLSLKSLILIDALTFLASAIILTFLKDNPAIARSVHTVPQHPFSLRGVLRDTHEAWAEIRSNRMIQDAIMFGAILAIFLEGSRFVFHHYMGLVAFKVGAPGVSLMVSVEAVGMIAGGFVTGILANWLMGGHYKLITLAVLTSLTYALQITAGSNAFYLIFLFWTSCLYQVYDIHTVNMVMASCPTHLLGKVSGLWTKVFGMTLIAIVSLVSAKIIPSTSSIDRILFFLGTPLTILVAWEVCKKTRKIKNPSPLIIDVEKKYCHTI